MTEEYFNIRYEFDREEVLSAIDRQLKEPASSYICVADGVVLSMVHRDQEYRNAVNGGMFTICDSSYVPLYLKWIYGTRHNQYCGSDIFSDVVEMKKYRQCFIGATDDILEGLRDSVSRIDPSVGGMLFMSLPFRNVDDFDYPGIARQIEHADPDIIWLALGAPKQEMFAKRLQPYLHRGVIIPVGAVFGFFSGTGVERAPEWMVKSHLEFLYRVMREPGKQIRKCWLIVRSLPSIFLEEYRRKYNGRNSGRQ